MLGRTKVAVSTGVPIGIVADVGTGDVVGEDIGVRLDIFVGDVVGGGSGSEAGVKVGSGWEQTNVVRASRLRSPTSRNRFIGAPHLCLQPIAHWP